MFNLKMTSCVVAYFFVASFSTLAAVIQIDDEDAGYSTTGSWTKEAAGAAYNDDEWYQSSANNGATATWEFSGLATGKYYIASSWVAGGNRTTAALYSLSDGIPSSTIDQSQATSFGFDDESHVGYARLSDFKGSVAYTISDGTLSVTASHGVGGLYLMADSIRLETANPDVEKVYVVDNEDSSGYSETGTWTSYSGDPATHRSNFRYASAASDTATFTFTGLDDGTYRISAAWTPGTYRPTDATYIISGGAVGTSMVSQVSAPNDDVFEGANWENLFQWVDITGGTLTVTLTNGVGGSGNVLIADAVRLEKISPQDFVLIDNFESHALNSSVDSAAGWVNTGSSAGTVVANPGALGKAAMLPSGDNDGFIIDLGDSSISDGKMSTLFLRYRSAGAISVYLTASDTIPSSQWWVIDEAGLYNNDSSAPSDIRPKYNVGNTSQIDLNTWYNLWIVVDHTKNTSDVYMSRNQDGAIGGATSVTIDTGVPFRTAAGDLDHFFFVSNNTSYGGMIDDIYIAPGKNLTRPADLAWKGTVISIQ